MRINKILIAAFFCFILVSSQDSTNTSDLYDDYPESSENQNTSLVSNDNQVSETSSETVNNETKTEDMNVNNDNNNDDLTWDDDTEIEATTNEDSSDSTESNIEESSSVNIDTTNSETVSENENESNVDLNDSENNINNDDITWGDDSDVDSNTPQTPESAQSVETPSESSSPSVSNETSANTVNENNTNPQTDFPTSSSLSQNETQTQAQNSSVENDEFEWELTNEESASTKKISKEATNDKFLSETSLSNENETSISQTNEVNFEEPMAEESSSEKPASSGLKVKCFWFNGHNETFDLSPLDNKTTDKKIEVTAKKNYFYNFCNPTVAKCNENLNLMHLVNDEKCTIMAGDNNQTMSEFEKMTMKTIVDEKEKEVITGLRVRMASGQKCASDETKTYQTTWEITCDEDKEAKRGEINVLNQAELDLDQPGRVDKCGIIVKAKSVHGCPLNNYYAVSAFIEANRIIFMIVIVVIGIFLTYLGSKIINVTLMITAFFATVIGVFLVVFGIFGAHKISNGIMWLIFSLTIVLAGGVGFLFYKFKQIFTISLGALTGYFFSMMLYNFVLRYIKSNPDVVYWVTLVVCVGLGVLVAIYLEKHLIITSTALLGGYATVRGASLVIGGFPAESEVIDLIRKGEFYQLSLMMNGLVYIYFGVMLLLIISGMIVQYKIYKGEDEEKVSSDDIDHKLTNKL